MKNTRVGCFENLHNDPFDYVRPSEAQLSSRSQYLEERVNNNSKKCSMPKVCPVRTLNHGKQQFVHYFHKPISMIGFCVVLALIQVSYSRVYPQLEAKSMPELGWETKQMVFSHRPKEQFEVSFMIGFGSAQSRFDFPKESETMENHSPFSGEVIVISESAVEGNSMEAPFSIQLESKHIGRQEKDGLSKRNGMSYGVNFEEKKHNQLEENLFQRGLDLSNLQDIVDKLSSNQLRNRFQTFSHLKRIRRILQYKKSQLTVARPVLTAETPKDEFDIDSELNNFVLAIEPPKEQREANPYEDLERKARSNLVTEIYKLDELRMPETYQQNISVKFEDKDQSRPDLSGEEMQQTTI